MKQRYSQNKNINTCKHLSCLSDAYGCLQLVSGVFSLFFYWLHTQIEMHTQSVVVPSSRVRLAPDGPPHSADSVEQHKTKLTFCVFERHSVSWERHKKVPVAKATKPKLLICQDCSSTVQPVPHQVYCVILS